MHFPNISCGFALSKDKPVFPGSTLTTLLYPLLLSQCWSYFKRYQMDKWYLKVMVIVIIVLHTVQEWFILYTAWHVLVKAEGTDSSTFASRERRYDRAGSLLLSFSSKFYSIRTYNLYDCRNDIRLLCSDVSPYGSSTSTSITTLVTTTPNYIATISFVASAATVRLLFVAGRDRTGGSEVPKMNVRQTLVEHAVTTMYIAYVAIHLSRSNGVSPYDKGLDASSYLNRTESQREPSLRSASSCWIWGKALFSVRRRIRRTQPLQFDYGEWQMVPGLLG
ncbi:hypothetical protein C8Q79DRAFT_927597 [Trametes meyenii]|nr:hypothetical protein C8Q79DRAFT_927597 [Trametes meyenii]